MRLRGLLPVRFRVATQILERDARNVVDAFRKPRTRICRSDFEPRPLSDTLERTTPEFHAPEPQPHAVLAQLVFSESGVTLDIRDPELSILEAGLGAGLDLNYSCTLGGCAACILDVLEGEVDYDDIDALCLTDDELESGDVCLACVGRPRGRVVIDA